MQIEIHQPEIEALIQQRLDSGAFRSVEEVLMQALQAAPQQPGQDVRTGADLIAAMQAMPYNDIDLEPVRPQMPVRDIAL